MLYKMLMMHLLLESIGLRGEKNFEEDFNSD